MPNVLGKWFNYRGPRVALRPFHSPEDPRREEWQQCNMCWDKRKVSWNQPQRHLSFTVQEWNSGISYKARKLYQETHPHPSLGDSRLVTLQSLTATGGLK